MKQIQVGGFRRISKAAARKEYDKGNDVFLLSCKIRPDFHGYDAVAVNRYSWGHCGTTFDQVCNAFEYYNCNNEAGRYAAFYTLDD